MQANRRIALIGDHDPAITAHRAIPLALSIAGAENNAPVIFDWLPSNQLAQHLDTLANDYHGLWCVPGSPYKNTNAVIDAITVARNNAIPMFGTCGGYQHMALEYARNCLGLSNADSTENNPDTQVPLVTPLSCSLRETRDAINLQPGSTIATIYKTTDVTEEYNCGYGLNRDYLSHFADTDLNISAYDHEQDPRALELNGHPFFIGVAYQPERSALKSQPHPLITAFIAATFDQQHTTQR